MNNNNNNLITLPKPYQNNVWSDDKIIAEVRKLCPANLTNEEFRAFVGIGMATQLNPFLKEIWAVKYDMRQPASIFIGRDGYRKIARRSADYDYHLPDAVYENDEFTVKDGIIHHTYNLQNRGQLIGAYCIVKSKSSSQPVFNFVNFEEYNLKRSLWLSKPATMIKKVAESQALRMVFNELSGTYDESEQWDSNSKPMMQANGHAAPLFTNKPKNDLDQDLYFISQCVALEELQAVFHEMQARYRQSQDKGALEALIAAKDKMKERLTLLEEVRVNEQAL